MIWIQVPNGAPDERAVFLESRAKLRVEGVIKGATVQKPKLRLALLLFFCGIFHGQCQGREAMEGQIKGPRVEGENQGLCRGGKKEKIAGKGR